MLFQYRHWIGLKRLRSAHNANTAAGSMQATAADQHCGMADCIACIGVQSDDVYNNNSADSKVTLAVVLITFHLLLLLAEVRLYKP